MNGETGATVGSVDVSNTTHTNAGTYPSDSWSFTGAANYNDISSTTITDSIDKATATVVVTPYNVTYNGQPHTATVTSITGVNGETGATVGTVNLSNTTHTNAGTYASDSWSFTGAANYNNIGSDDHHRQYRAGAIGSAKLDGQQALHAYSNRRWPTWSDYLHPGLGYPADGAHS